MLENLELEKLIEPCKLIETKHQSDNNWIITVILNSFGNFIEIKQVEDYLNSILMIGDRLQCKFVTNKAIYLIEAEVYNVKFASRAVVLKASDIKTIENIRKYRRYDVYLSASFSKKGTVGENYCVIVNVSAEGLSIITRSGLEMDERINIGIYFHGFHFLMAECAVKWQDKINGNNLYGLLIVDMDEITRFQYLNYIKKLQRKERTLRKKGENLL